MTNGSGNRVQRWLSTASPAAFTTYAASAAFATYFCMYGYRKAFAVGTFAGHVGALDYKTLFLISQVLGYAASKFLGIKIVSEMTPAKRARAIVGLIALSEIALLFFAIVPPPWSALFMVMNGLPLGMIWGLVFGFLEGRKVSDLLGTSLCASFIVSSGFVKTVGKWVMTSGVPEMWMPFVVGLMFFPPLVLFVVFLAQIPPPTASDESARTKRAPMDGPARTAFFKAYAPGLVALVAVYMVLTAYRDFRDNFAREIWDALGYANTPEILTTAEIPVAFGSLLAVSAIALIADNRKALLALHGLMLFGAVLVGGSTLAYDAGMISPAAWMVAVGLGLYLGYVPFNSVLFDRLIAAMGSVATAGFLIYVADAFGYLGSVGLLLTKSFARPDLSWLEFFRALSYGGAAITVVLYVVSAAYFERRTR